MEKFNSSLFSRRYDGYNLEKEICIINKGIIENDVYALDFLREANCTYNRDREYFYSLYKTLENSSNCGMYLILTAVLLKNEDEKANLEIADKKIDLLIQKMYNSYYVKYNIAEHIGTPNSITVINNDIIYEDDKRYELIKKFHTKKSAFGYYSALRPYRPYNIKKTPSADDIEFIKKCILNNYRIYYILLLSDYSKKSKKLLNIILKTNNYKCLIYLILIRKEGFNITYQESLDYLLNLDMPLSDTIISYIFFYSYNDRISYYNSFAVQIKNNDFNNFFYSIIKKNSEYFENLFSNKNFINRVTKNSRNFIPFLNELYSKEIDFKSSKILCSLLGSKSPNIRKASIKIINRKKNESYKYLKTLNSNLAKDILKKWKNKKIIKSGFKDINSIVAFVNKNYNKKYEKNLLCLDESLLYGVKMKDSNEVIPIIIIKYIYLEYSKLKLPTKIKYLDKIISYFNFDSFINVIKNIYDRWIFEGADITYKYVMMLYLVYESEYKIEKVIYNLKNWCESGRISLANYAISALAFNGSIYSLILIDYIQTNFKYYQIKNTSKSAFKSAAKKLNISEDGLEDKIIPNFSINKYGKKILKDDFNSFTLTINEKLYIEKIYDNKNKEYISKIDKYCNISEKLLDEFHSLKNNIKSIYRFQSLRLHKALMTGKKWQANNWKNIFIENYIMSLLSDIFIWTVYSKNDKILKHVRYDKKSNKFFTLDNEEYKINSRHKLSLASSIEMTDEEIKKAKKLLANLNIKQPFNQMQKINFNFKEGDIKENIIIKYRNKEAKIKVFKKLADSINMELDYENSYIVGYKIIETSISVGIKINLIGIDNAIDDNDIIMFGDIVFYNIDNSEVFSYKNIMDPRTSHERYVKYIMFNIDNHIRKNKINKF